MSQFFRKLEQYVIFIQLLLTMDFMKRIKVSLVMNTNLKFFILLGFTSITIFFPSSIAKNQ